MYIRRDPAPRRDRRPSGTDAGGSREVAEGRTSYPSGDPLRSGRPRSSTRRRARTVRHRPTPRPAGKRGPANFRRGPGCRERPKAAVFRLGRSRRDVRCSPARSGDRDLHRSTRGAGRNACQTVVPTPHRRPGGYRRRKRRAELARPASPDHTRQRPDEAGLARSVVPDDAEVMPGSSLTRDARQDPGVEGSPAHRGDRPGPGGDMVIRGAELARIAGRPRYFLRRHSDGADVGAGIPNGIATPREVPARRRTSRPVDAETGLRSGRIATPFAAGKPYHGSRPRTCDNGSERSRRCFVVPAFGTVLPGATRPRTEIHRTARTASGTERPVQADPVRGF